MNLGALLILMMVVLTMLGIPIAFSIGISTMLSILLSDGWTLMYIPQKLFLGMNSTALLAIPFFVLAGNVMSVGITGRILNVSNAFIGSKKGSFGIVSVLASAIFASISGSGTATVSAIGGITIPAMKNEGYPPAFATAIASMASCLGPLIPPSIFLIVYGNATETSVGQLFLASVIPGVGLALVLMIYAAVYAGIHNFPTTAKVSGREKLKTLKDSVFALFMPLLILGGIFGGIFTATEAAAVSALYALIVSLFVYRDLKFEQLSKLFIDSAITSAALLFLTGLSKASGVVVVLSKFPTVLVDALRSLTDSRVVMFLLINIFLLIVGMLIEANAAIVMLVPLLLPLAQAYGISAIHLGVVMGMNFCLGLVTPPVGCCVLLGSQIGNVPLGDTMKQIVVPLLLGIAMLLATTYIPAFTQWLPGLMG